MSAIPLHVKSSYSLLSSTISLDAYIQFAVDQGWSAVSLCDNQVMYGAVEFYQKAKANHLKAIIGLSFPWPADSKENDLTLALFAKNQQGYHHLCQLSTLIQSGQWDSDSARTFFQNLKQTIFIIPQQCMAEEAEKSLRQLLSHLDSSNEIYQGERTGPNGESFVFSDLPALPFDCFDHLTTEDKPAVALLDHIAQKSQASLEALQSSSEKRQTYPLEEWGQLQNSYSSQSLMNLEDLVEKLEWEMELGKRQLPAYPIPGQQSAEDYLRELAFQALNEKGLVGQEYVERLEKELQVINQMGFADYFLIVWDIMAYAKSQDIQTGPGRGSAAGSLVAFVLDIISVDPIRYGLIFERFLNIERFSPPDIDLDFPDNKRQDIINYIRQTYGLDHVAQIITFGSLGAKQALRDTGRVLGLDQGQQNGWSKTIPSQPGIKLAEAYDQSKALRQKVQYSSFNQELFQLACKIEGLYRNTSTHASGIVISRYSLHDQLPLQATHQNILQTQYPMDDLEALGLMKFDILGLRNLTILHDTVQNIQKQTEEKFDLKDIPLDDKKSYQLFQQADTNGVFQFESDGIKAVLKRLAPSEFEDIVAVIALYRPGPMNEISNYIDRKHQKQTISYLHPDLEDILSSTKGIMIYQEQIMKIAQLMAGYSLGEADMFRRAISKKDSQLLADEKSKFTQGALERGYDHKVIDQVFQAIERFADYGFNRSHAVAYSLLAYRLAYLKVHYPHSFYAALLKSANGDKAGMYLVEALKKNLKVSLPRLNVSQFYPVARQQKIILGFNQIKGVKKQTFQSLLDQRRQGGAFEDFIDFCKRVKAGVGIKEELEVLIYSGVFDGLGQNRASLLNSLEGILSNLESGQFSATLGQIFQPQYQSVDELPVLEAVEKELEFTGLSPQNHPLKDFQPERQTLNLPYLKELAVGYKGPVALTYHEMKQIQTKNGELMAFLKLSDPSAIIEATLFPQAYRQIAGSLHESQSYLCQMEVEKRKGQSSFILQQIKPMKDIQQSMKQEVFIQVSDLKPELFHKIQHFIQNRSGFSPVFIHNQANKQTYRLKVPYLLHLTSDHVQQLREWLGEQNVVVKNWPKA